MKKVTLAQVPVEHRRFPKGRFELERQHVSLALGGIKELGPWGVGHGFDIEWTTLPPGKANYPPHSHAAPTKHFIILSGIGILPEDKGGEERPAARDHVFCHPGETHQMENRGTPSLVFYAIADHPRADVSAYPHTGKRHLKLEDRVVSVAETDCSVGGE